MVGGHLVKSWSSTQQSGTLSSAEAELVAAVKMAAELIGLSQLAHDWGREVKGRLHVDSTAAIGICKRSGNGKMRHVRVGTLWIQEKLSEGELDMQKVLGEQNPADVCTKGLNEAKSQHFMHMVGQHARVGRATKSLRNP